MSGLGTFVSNSQRLCRRKNYGSQLAEEQHATEIYIKNLGFSVSRATQRKPFTRISSARIFARISARICCTNFLHRFLHGILARFFWMSQTTCWEAPKTSPTKSAKTFSMLLGPSGEGLGRQESEVETLANRTKASLRGLESAGGHQWRKYRHSSGLEPWTEILSCVPSFSRGNFAKNPLRTLDGWAIRNEDRGNSCESIRTLRFAETP